MIVLIEVMSSGGFGGLANVQTNRNTRIEDLPTTDQSTYCNAFAPSALEEIAGLRAPEGRADTISYEITVTDDHGVRQSFILDETILPPDLLDLIDALPREK